MSGAADPLPRVPDGKGGERRVMGAEHHLERAELNRQVTAAALRRRALELGAARNGHGPVDHAHP